MQVELTDKLLRSFKPPSEGRLEVSDTKRRGLRFRLSSKGIAVWMYEKRVKGGPKRKHTLGKWPSLSLSEARSISLEIEAEANRGVDRIENERQRREDDALLRANRQTVREVIEVYSDLHLSNLRTGAERKRQLLTGLEDRLNAPINDLTPEDFQRVIDAKMMQGRRVYANRIRSALIAFSKWAWVRGHVSEHIGLRLAKPTKESPRDRELKLDEVRAIYQACEELGPIWGPLVRLLILTGQRRSEITSLRWSEIDFDKSQILKAGARTKNGKPHITYLSDEARKIVDAIPRTDCDYLFSTTGSTPVSGLSKVKARLDLLLGDRVQPWRFHDLRTAMASTLCSNNVPEAVADRILNHVATGSAPSVVSRTYNLSELLPERKDALCKWSRWVLGEVPKHELNVIEFRSSAL